MSTFDCPSCKQGADKLIIFNDPARLGCPGCRTSTIKKAYNVNLGQTLDKWTHIDKKTGREIKHRLTTGKDWEIANRAFSKEDGKTAINRITGKETQY